LKRIKKLGFVALGFIGIFVALSGKHVSALETLITEKEVPLTIIVTAAAYDPSRLGPGHPGGVQVADISSYDVPMGIHAPVVIGQSAQQQGAVHVKFLTKPDPTATYLHEIPINTTLTAPQGATTYFACPFEMYAYYKTTYNVTDWGYGTSTTPSTGTFPVLNYPSKSDLAWVVTAVGVPPAANATYTPYSDSGAPGQTAFSGSAGEQQTQCINLAVTVPATEPVGTYTAVIQYNLYST